SEIGSQLSYVEHGFIRRTRAKIDSAANMSQRRCQYAAANCAGTATSTVRSAPAALQRYFCGFPGDIQVRPASPHRLQTMATVIDDSTTAYRFSRRANVQPSA